MADDKSLCLVICCKSYGEIIFALMMVLLSVYLRSCWCDLCIFMSKKVSILMLTYNGEKYLKEAIDSCLNQILRYVLLMIKQ